MVDRANVLLTYFDIMSELNLRPYLGQADGMLTVKVPVNGDDVDVAIVAYTVDELIFVDLDDESLVNDPSIHLLQLNLYGL